MLKQNTLTFTSSDVFTHSFTFSPFPTKFPDGFTDYKSNLSGQFFLNQPEYIKAVYAIVICAILFMIVSVALMVSYLKHKTIKTPTFSHPLLNISSESSSSYSYSYYCYDYQYSSDKDYEITI